MQPPVSNPLPLRLPVLPPLSLYVHLPWCVKKCPYCDFNSHVREALPWQAYLAVLQQDFSAQRYRLHERPIQTIFFGGGTPSLLPGEFYQQFLSWLQASYPLAADIEITLEANPGAVDEAHFAGYRQAGINRISLGVQSFDDGLLQALGRVHDAAAAHKAIRLVQALDFPRLNLDIMYGLPGQNLTQVLHDLQQALDYASGHVSWYQLTLEPNTAFWRHPPRLPVADFLADMSDAGVAYLAERGYRAYEISAYASDAQQQCRHNLNYWQFGDYVGIGAGAHGKLSLPDQIMRTQQAKQPEKYLQQTQFPHQLITLTEPDLIFEYWLNALRLFQPIEDVHFELRTGLPIHSAEALIQQATAKGFLLSTPTGYKKTELGDRFVNDVQMVFLP